VPTVFAVGSRRDSIHCVVAQTSITPHRPRPLHIRLPPPTRPPSQEGCHSASIGDIYGTLELEDTITAWQSVVQRNGPADARQSIRQFEAEHGPIVYREIALAAMKGQKFGPSKSVGGR